MSDQLHQYQDRSRCLFGWLHYNAVAGGQCRCKLPYSHQDREVPRDDLAYDTQRLMVMIGHGVMVDLADRAFLRTDTACEVAEVVNRQWDISIGGFAQRFAVIDSFSDRNHFQVGFHDVSNLVQNDRALSS